MSPRRTPIVVGALVMLLAVCLGLIAVRSRTSAATEGSATVTAATVPPPSPTATAGSAVPAVAAEPLAPGVVAVAPIATTAIAPPSPSVETHHPGAAPTTSSPAIEPPTTRAPVVLAPSDAPPPSDASAPADTPAPSGASTSTGPDPECPPTGHGAIVDRLAQRGWLCDDGTATTEFPITSANSMPDPGTYPVYAKDMNASSTFGGHFSTMTHFVAFTYGERTHARIAFHSVPTLSNGAFVQPLESVGEIGRRGESSGCIRVLPDDALVIWDWLSLGDVVSVVS